MNTTAGVAADMLIAAGMFVIVVGMTFVTVEVAGADAIADAVTALVAASLEEEVVVVFLGLALTGVKLTCKLPTLNPALSHPEA